MTSENTVCRACGSHVNPGATFCGNCGAKIEQASPAVTSYCRECGAALSADSAFCLSCGAPASRAAEQAAATDALYSASTFCLSCGALVAENSAFCLECGAPVAASPAAVANRPTQVMPQVQPAPAPGPVQQQQAPKGNKTPIIILAAVLAVVVVAVIAIFAIRPAFIFGEPEGDWGDLTAPQDVPSSKPSDKNDAPSSNGTTTTQPKPINPGDNAAAVDETALYEDLWDAYSELEALDNDIATCANDFNNNFTNSSWSTRQAYLDQAEYVYRAVQSSRNYFAKLKPSTSSKLYSSYQNLLECYDCCYYRIEVIYEAWQRSVNSSDPAADQNYILEPLARDKVNGHNKYKTRFDELYPKSAPQR